MFKKLKNNNRGYSSINWMTLLIITMILLSALMDVANLGTVKMQLVQRVNYLANVGTIQGGFGGGKPHGWDWNFGGSVPYVTYNEAKDYFRAGFSKYGSGSVSGVDINIPGTVGYQQEGTVIGSVTFKPSFSRVLSNANSLRLTHEARFCGFWIYRNDTIV